MTRVDDPQVIARVKQQFALDGGAEREHNATADTLGFGAIHYSLVVNLRPKRVLVIGSRYGYVPAVIGLALHVNGCGTLDFVDANYSDATDGFETAYGGVGYWTEDPAERFALFGLNDFIRAHVAQTADFFPLCQAEYGYICIDADHSYEGCRHDLERKPVH